MSAPNHTVAAFLLVPTTCGSPSCYSSIYILITLKRTRTDRAVEETAVTHHPQKDKDRQNG
eukprot:2041757-Pyramimonas_sp.AAC.1